jgi:hypothetical protein
MGALQRRGMVAQMVLPELAGGVTEIIEELRDRRGAGPQMAWAAGELWREHSGAHGFQEYWGYLYHLDAMEQVSFPDINGNPTTQAVAPPCKNTPVPLTGPP